MDSRVATYEHIQTVQRKIGNVIADLQRRQIEHDQSKLVSPEVEIFDEYTPKLKNSTYGSEEYKSFLAGMKPALEHHYFNNSHHPEYWAYNDATYYEDDVRNGKAISRMSLIDLIEMLCDWKAATARHSDGDIRKSIEINQKRFGYSDELKQIFLNTLKVVEK